MRLKPQLKRAAVEIACVMAAYHIGRRGEGIMDRSLRDLMVLTQLRLEKAGITSPNTKAKKAAGQWLEETIRRAA